MSKDEQDAHAGVNDVEMTDADKPEKSPPPSDNPQTKRKKKSAKHTTLSQFTIRKPVWAYIHLSMIAASAPDSTSGLTTPAALDPLTAQIQLQAALSSFLGLHGTAIPFDFLKIQGQNLWLRVPREDVSAVVAAVGGWIGKNGQGWRVNNWSYWGPDAARNSGIDLFDT